MARRATSTQTLPRQIKQAERKRYLAHIPLNRKRKGQLGVVVPGTPSDRYFFSTGESKLGSATGDCERALKGMFMEAGIPDGHADRFRDTLASGILQAGVPMERVSVLLATVASR